MLQMKIDPDAIIPINYNDPFIPESLRIFSPVLFRDGDSFCCLFGPDPQSGIFGCGDTPDKAIENWDIHFQDQLVHPTADEEILDYINDSLQMAKKEF